MVENPKKALSTHRHCAATPQRIFAFLPKWQNGKMPWGCGGSSLVSGPSRTFCRGGQKSVSRSGQHHPAGKKEATSRQNSEHPFKPPRVQNLHSPSPTFSCLAHPPASPLQLKQGLKLNPSHPIPQILYFIRPSFLGLSIVRLAYRSGEGGLL